MALQKPKKCFTMTELEEKSRATGRRKSVFSPNGDLYNGQWLNDWKHGWGTEITKQSGSKYQGEWKFGKPNGYGVYSEWISETKQYIKKYIGEWDNGIKHGFGTFFYKTSAVYEGEWCQGLKEGLGIMYCANGDHYEGYWRRNTIHGFGIFRLSNGNKYEGFFEDGIPNGEGRFYNCEMRKFYEGFWVKGSPVIGNIHDFETDKAPTPSTHSIPKEFLVDMERVFMNTEKAEEDHNQEV